MTQMHAKSPRKYHNCIGPSPTRYVDRKLCVYVYPLAQFRLNRYLGVTRFARELPLTECLPLGHELCFHGSSWLSTPFSRTSVRMFASIRRGYFREFSQGTDRVFFKSSFIVDYVLGYYRRGPFGTWYVGLTSLC